MRSLATRDRASVRSGRRTRMSARVPAAGCRRRPGGRFSSNPTRPLWQSYRRGLGSLIDLLAARRELSRARFVALDTKLQLLARRRRSRSPPARLTGRRRRAGRGWPATMGPQINVIGSFFPSWMLCAAIGHRGDSARAMDSSFASGLIRMWARGRSCTRACASRHPGPLGDAFQGVGHDSTSRDRRLAGPAPHRPLARRRYRRGRRHRRRRDPPPVGDAAADGRCDGARQLRRDRSTGQRPHREARGPGQSSRCRKAICLFLIDPRPYEIALERARPRWRSPARRSTASGTASATAEAGVSRAEAQLRRVRGGRDTPRNGSRSWRMPRSRVLTRSASRRRQLSPVPRQSSSTPTST